jgi:Family of unknown function (DUF6384)/Caspase domain
MRPVRWIVVVALLPMLAVAWPALAEKRVALVVGNSTYLYTPKLDNPKNDAADMAATLRKHGFQVIEGLDVDKGAFDRKVLEFAVALKGADAGVFFYAGHGLQVAGKNYLVPIDAKGEEAVALDLEMVRVDVVHGIMERQTNTNILFLDACRDNPLARDLARSMGTRSTEVGHGLAQVEAGIGTLVSFATQPGNVALDGSGRNSPFTGALLRHLAAPKDDLSAILIDVRNDVMRETKNRQVPWEHVALRARFYFSPPVPKGSEEQSRIELTETLPKVLRQAYANVLAVTTDPAAKQKADALLVDGERALSEGNREAASKLRGKLSALADELAREYTLTIVSRPGESTAIWRRPPDNNQARNYYLIVEALAPDGRKLSVPVRNEETGETETVTRFGVRVPEEVYEQVRRDKIDDGIVQKNRFGVKRRGTLEVDYQMPFEGGFITQW